MSNLNKELLNEYFTYSNGNLYWKKKTGYKPVVGNLVCNKLSSNGYNILGFFGKRYYQHQIIFLMHHGYLPKCIDHINQNKADNRIENLRDVTVSENGQNSKLSKRNTTGIKGIAFNKARNQYVVQKMINKQSIFGGWFYKLEDAINCLNKINRSVYE